MLKWAEIWVSEPQGGSDSIYPGSPPDRWSRFSLRAWISSSARLPRSCYAAPAASYSSGDHPMPNPTRSRPPDKIIERVSRRASKTGLYQGILRTLVPSARRRACATANVRRLQRFQHALLLYRQRAVADRGYGTRGLTGHIMRSSTHRLSKPKSSARLATVTRGSGPTAEPTCGSANPKRIKSPCMTHLGSSPDHIKTYGGAHHLSFNLDRFALRLLNGISALSSRPTSSLLREMRLGQFPSVRIFS
jgi:hypothetical protein